MEGRGGWDGDRTGEEGWDEVVDGIMEMETEEGNGNMKGEPVLRLGFSWGRGWGKGWGNTNPLYL